MAPRPESQIFDDLGNLCTQAGYAHAIAAFCFRDNVITYDDALMGQHLLKMHSRGRLIRTEISTLIGLMAKRPLDFTMPGTDVIDAYMNHTESLLHELHLALNSEWTVGLTEAHSSDKAFNPFERGAALREPIFYGGDSAHIFQYRDLAVLKYQHDDPWLRAHRKFSVATASRIIEAVGKVQDRNLLAHLKSLREVPQEQWSMLAGFCFTPGEIAAECGSEEEEVLAVLDAFTFDPHDRNATFQTLQDFNVTNATPIFHYSEGALLTFHAYGPAEALYESPFYWMMRDKVYAQTAVKHRGDFTESVSRQFLERVFGKKRVHQGVILPKKKGLTYGEIDVLVLFGDRAIVVQAKSKRLTQEARKGNELVLKEDFKKAIQDACDQATDCATALLDVDCQLLGTDGKPIRLTTKPKVVFSMCIVADHYPALNFQAKQFLKVNEHPSIARPLVSDVFALDVMTEMLNSPLRFLSYLTLRAQFADRILITHELSLLGYYLKRNLWIENEYDLIVLEDDVAADLDAAMLVRREGLPGERTPPGILTRFQGITIGRFISAIDTSPSAPVVALGLFLLELDEDTMMAISSAMDQLSERTRLDGRQHDATFCVGDKGLTLHTSYQPDAPALESLERHCHIRKYTQKAIAWFGVALHPTSVEPRFGVSIDYPWIQDDLMDANLADMKVGPLVKGKRKDQRGAKTGRNAPCPCGSGKKYKKCCIC